MYCYSQIEADDCPNRPVGLQNPDYIRIALLQLIMSTILGRHTWPEPTQEEEPGTCGSLTQ